MPHLYLTASQYIFDENFYETRNILICGIALFLLLLHAFFIEKPRYYTDSHGQKQDKYKIGGVVLTIIALVIYGSLHSYFFKKRIQDNAIVTTGVIVHKEWKYGKNGGWQYVYHFVAKGKLYERYKVYSCSETDHREATQDSCYRIIYNANDPEESIMDLHAPEHCPPQ